MLKMFQELLPVADTQAAHQWDNLYLFLFIVCVFFFLTVMVPMVVFAIKYRKKPGVKPTYIERNETLEAIWTIIPTIVLMVIFAWGYIAYKHLQDGAPPNAMEVRVLARQWNWSFQYDDGRTTSGELFVPVNTPVKLIITSRKNDVIHSFFVPNFRIKKDAVPGMYTSAWFKADKVGQNLVFCAEYCGAGHSGMHAKIIVLDQKRWQLWKWGKEIKLPPWIGYGDEKLAANGSTKTETVKAAAIMPHKNLITQGKELSQERGCTACHSVDGSKGVGPTYRGLYGSKALLADGSTVLADENYIRESIENPQAKIVKGYENLVMPPYPGQMADVEINALIAYIKSIK